MSRSMDSLVKAMEQAGFPHLHDRYLMDELSESDRRAFEAHTLECPACADEVVTGSQFIEAARTVLRRRTQEFVGPVVERGAAGAPAATEAVSWRRRLWPGGARGRWIPRMVALAGVPLLAAVAYQGAVVIPRLEGELTRRDQPAALTPITLRPPTRGPKQEIVLQPQDHRLVLAVGPLDAGGAARLEVGVRRADGTPLVPAFVVQSPPLAGEPLQIVLPTSPLIPGEYEVVVQAVGEQGTRDPFKVRRYPFSIVRRPHGP